MAEQPYSEKVMDRGLALLKFVDFSDESKVKKAINLAVKILVGKGIGPEIFAPVERAVLIISRHAASITRAS